MAIERVMDAIACALGLDPLDVRKANLYGVGERNLTPYGQTVEDNIAARADRPSWRRSCDYRARARRRSPPSTPTARCLKRGIALTPVKFGISFTTTHLNQAGALVHVYTDGSIHLNHGGTEMGQGLFIKVAQVVAEEFAGRRSTACKITATNTGKVPNTSATAASSGTDLNGMAAQNAAQHDQGAADRLRRRDATACAPERGRVSPTASVLHRRRERCAFARARPRGLSRRASRCPPTGYLHDARRSTGTAPRHRAGRSTISPTARPCREVAIDTLTGEKRVAARRHPARRRPLAQPGDRHRPDRGRLHPGHGLADHRGAGVRRQGPAAHPRALDLQDPRRAATGPTTSTWRSGRRRRTARTTIYRSKAVGEPPLMLAISVLLGAHRRRRQPGRLSAAAGPRRAGDAGAHPAGDRAKFAAAERQPRRKAIAAGAMLAMPAAPIETRAMSAAAGLAGSALTCRRAACPAPGHRRGRRGLRPAGGRRPDAGPSPTASPAPSAAAHLEFKALAEAKSLLQTAMAPQAALLDFALGPSLGQCCGGQGYPALRAADAPPPSPG